MLPGRFDGPAGLFAIHQIECDGQQRIAAQGRVAHGLLGRMILVGMQAVGEPAQSLVPEEAMEGVFRLPGQIGPAAGGIDRGAVEPGQQAQQPDPEHLDLDGVALTRGPRRMVGIHPGEMTGAPDQTTGGVHADALGGALQVADRDGSEHIPHGPALTVARVQVEHRLGTERIGLGQFFGHDAVPERGVTGLPVGGVFAVDRVGQGARLFEAPEGDQELADLGEAVGRDEAAGGDERIAPPVQEPGIARDDAHRIVPSNHETADGPSQQGLERASRAAAQDLLTSSDETVELGLGHVGRLGGDRDRGGITRTERDLEPSGAEGVSGTIHPPAGLDRMGDVPTPFDGRMKTPAGRQNPECPRRVGLEAEARAVGRRVRRGAGTLQIPGRSDEMGFGLRIEPGLPVEVAVFQIDPHHQPHIAGSGQGTTEAGVVAR